MKLSAALIGLVAVTGLDLFALVASGPSRAQTPGISENAPEGAPVPLPYRNPARTPSQKDTPPPHPSELEAPAWTAQDIQSARDRCAMVLDGMGYTFRRLDPLREGVCGTPAPVELQSIGTNPPVKIEPPARVTCELAASLGAWADKFLQPAAQTHLGEPVTAIRNVASYVCRNRYNAADKPISEHARANALDMVAFRTESGNWITVQDKWALPQPRADSLPAGETPIGVTSSPPVTISAAEETGLPAAKAGTVPLENGATPESDPEPEPAPAPAPAPETSFLRDIHSSACNLFGTVLGPEANEAHQDHFHFDLAQRNHGNYCE